MKKSLYFFLFLFLPPLMNAQIYHFTTDALQQGYYNRPYDRYEAEPTLCSTNGCFLEATDNQEFLQSEASHQQAVQLSSIGDYVSWTVERAGAGLTIRFSLPDSSDGTGIDGQIAVCLNDVPIDTITLSSYWAWQYTASGANYPDNTPGSEKMVRMRFDETHLLLSEVFPQGGTLKLVKLDGEAIPYTIDFVELEPVPDSVEFSEIADDNKVQYNPSCDGDLAAFVKNNGGRTIYLPAGRIVCADRIYLNVSGTKLIGAGMWYTEVYYSAPSDQISTYSRRGIEASKDNMLVEGIFFNTINNRRYYNNDNNKQVGKAFMGSWGKKSVIRNCWAEHFECGGWIADYSGYVSEDLLVEGCRFRNNYADGINCSQASNRHIIRCCSFRNNGDDDMASWTTSRRCVNVEFAYCTAENNWRASSLGFFGGTGHRAHHLAIFDGLESGIRVNADFSGLGFGDTARIYIHDVTVDHCGCKGGTRGVSGDFWGNKQGAVNIGNTANYDVKHLTMENICVVNSRSDALYVRATGNRYITDLVLQDIVVKNTPRYGIYYAGAKGTATYCHLSFEGCELGEQNTHMPTFVVTDCETALEEAVMLPFPAEGPYYNVQGIEVDATSRGVVIAGGRKFLR